MKILPQLAILFALCSGCDSPSTVGVGGDIADQRLQSDATLDESVTAREVEGFDGTFTKLREMNGDSERLQNLLNIPFDKVAEFSLSECRVFVLSGFDYHGILTFDRKFNIIEFEMGSHCFSDFRALLEHEPDFRLELICGTKTPSHYTVSNSGDVTAIFCSRTGFMDAAQHEAQEGYLDNVSWVNTHQAGPER